MAVLYTLLPVATAIGESLGVAAPIGRRVGWCPDAIDGRSRPGYRAGIAEGSGDAVGESDEDPRPGAR